MPDCRECGKGDDVGTFVAEDLCYVCDDLLRREEGRTPKSQAGLEDYMGGEQRGE